MFRSSIIYMDNQGDPRSGASFIIAGATLYEAVCWAANTNKENRHVKRLLKTGLTPALKLKATTPAVCVAWIKNEANNFQAGAGYTPQEYMDDVPKANQSWREAGV